MSTNIESTGLSSGIRMNFTPLKNAMSNPIANSDLTQRPPRSVHSRLGGFVLLPRILDVGQHSKTREDIKTWFEALDLDDFVSSAAKHDRLNL